MPNNIFQKALSSDSGAGGTTDNTTEPNIPYKVGGTFENSPLRYDSNVDEVISTSTIRADIIAPTGSISFEDASVLSTNTENLELEDCVRSDMHEFITAIYTNAGSTPPRQSVKSALQTFNVHLTDDEQSNSFEVVFPTLINVHFKDFIIKPKEAGDGIFILRDIDETGCILNTETKFTITLGQVNTEVIVPLKNRIKLFAGQDVWISYNGINLAGHQYTSDPTWGDQFVPFAKTKSQPFTNTNLIRAIDSVTYLSDVTSVGSGDIITGIERTKLNGIEEGAQKNDIDQIKAIRDTNKVLDGTEQILDFDIISQNAGITMPTDGFFEVSRDGYYEGTVTLNINESSNPDLFLWAETRVDNVSAWSPTSTLMIKQFFKEDGSFTVHVNGGFNLDNGNQIRVMVKRDNGNITLTKETETLGGQTLTQYPVFISMYRAGNKII